MDLSLFNTKSIASCPRSASVKKVLTASIAAVEPKAAIKRYMRLQDGNLVINNRSYDLDTIDRIFVIGAGKAGEPMARAVESILSDRLFAGIVITKDGYVDDQLQSGKIQIYASGHPIPDARGVEATRKIIDLLKSTQPNDMVICLISGGGSALMTSPVPDIYLADFQKLTSSLLACGADIHEINTLRKHLDKIKGGQLAKYAFPAKVETLILSDVVGNSLDVIASGPTVPDSSTYSDALAVIEKYNLYDQVSPTIIHTLETGKQRLIPETPKDGDSIFDNVKNTIIASNLMAAQAALKQSELEGFNSLLLTTYLQGEASQAGRFLASVVRQIAENEMPLLRPACLIAGGETTVSVHGNGIGGRNQELALGAVSELSGLQDVLLVSFATDGGDGFSDAAGASVTGKTLSRALKYGINPDDFLKENDSYHFFKPLKDLLMTGPTYTNVNDLIFLFAF